MLYSSSSRFFARLLTALLLLVSGGAWAQTSYALSAGSYTQDFSQISAWTNSFASGAGAAPFSVATSTPTLPNQNNAFVSGTTGGVQKGAQAIVLLATGGDNANAAAFDLNLDFSGTTAGTISLDWAEVNNATGTRQSTFKLQTNTGPSGAFVDLPGSSVVLTNSTPASGKLISLALPTAFDNNAAARIRFYILPTAGGTNPSGSRPKVSLDNLLITTTPAGPATPTLTTGTITGSPFCVTASDGAAVSVPFTATGSLTGSFAAQLSDATGSFSADLAQNLIGTGSASPFTATLPAGSPAGTGYRIRVVHAASGTVGSVNSSSLTITTPPANNAVTVDPAIAQSLTTTSIGTLLTATATVPSSFVWLYATTSTGPFTTALPGATAPTYTPKGNDFGGPGTYYVVAKTTSTCGSVEGTSAPVTVTVSAPQPTLTVTPNPVPNFGSVVVGTASTFTTLSLSGSSLSGTVTLTPPSGFQLRTGTTAFSCTPLTLTPTDGNFSATVDVRFVPALAQAYNATITVINASSATLPSIQVSGTGISPVYPPSLSTAPATGMTATTATAGGEVLEDGGSPVTARGVVYATTEAPTTQDDFTQDGSGLSAFTSTLSDLLPNTTYYVRAYATTAAGTSYGPQMSLTTAAVALAPEPTRSSVLTASELTGSSVKLTFTGGDGAKRLLLARRDGPVSSDPGDGVSYPANAAYGQGSVVEAGTYAVYAGTGTEVVVTGLTAGTVYGFAVYEYNDNEEALATNYRTQDPGTLIITTPALPAQLLLEEHFEYAAGSPLSGTGNWAAHSGEGTNEITVAEDNLTQDGYGAARGGHVTLSGSGEDINRQFTAVAAGSSPVYLSALVRITSATTGGDYFLHLANSTMTNTTYRARVFVRRTAAGSIQFGISSDGSPLAYSPTDYSLNTTYLLVVKYTFDGTAQLSELYVNPALGATEPGTADASAAETADSPADIGSVALRQGGNAAATLVVDGLRVGTSFASVRQAATPLPVSLIGFTGQAQGRNVRLRWQTAQELGNDRFDVERSGDGRRFTRIATLGGQGTTAQAHAYDYLDVGALQEKSTMHYRLRQVDRSGTATYSGVVVVTGAREPVAALQVYPNPVFTYEQVQVSGNVSETIQVLDLTGRVLRTHPAKQPLPLHGLAPGMYLIRAGSSTTRLEVR